MSDTVFRREIDSRRQWGYGTCYGGSFSAAKECRGANATVNQQILACYYIWLISFFSQIYMLQPTFPAVKFPVTNIFIGELYLEGRKCVERASYL